MGWLPYLALCSIGLVSVLVSIEPNASEGLTILQSTVFWSVHVVPALALLTLTQRFVGQLDKVSALPGIAQVLISAVIASVLFTPFALWLDSVLAGPVSYDGDEDGLALRLVTEMGHFFVPLVLIWALINAPSLLQLDGAGMRRPAVEDRALPAEADTGAAAEFWARVPGRYGRDLIALSAELHYLRVHTTQGETLILFPFGRAVEALQDHNGMQVHRSHWVALDRIDEVVSRDGRTACQMIGGLSVPVSRSYRAALKAAHRSNLASGNPASQTHS